MCVRVRRAPRCIAQTGLHAGSGQSLCGFWQACMCLWFGETESCREGWEVVGPSPVKLARVGRWPHRSQRAACRIWKLQRPSLFIPRVDASTRAGRWGCRCRKGADWLSSTGDQPRAAPAVSRGKREASPGSLCTSPQQRAPRSEPGHACCPSAVPRGLACSALPQRPPRHPLPSEDPPVQNREL